MWEWGLTSGKHASVSVSKLCEWRLEYQTHPDSYSFIVAPRYLNAPILCHVCARGQGGSGMAVPCLVTCGKQGVRQESALQGNGLAADTGSMCGHIYLREAWVARTGTCVGSLEKGGRRERESRKHRTGRHQHCLFPVRGQFGKFRISKFNILSKSSW